MANISVATIDKITYLDWQKSFHMISKITIEKSANQNS